MKMISLLQEIQPEALSGQCPTDVETIFEFYIPDRYNIETGYGDLSVLGDNVLGYTDAKQKVSVVDKTLSDSTEQSMIRRFRATVAHEIFHCMCHVPILNSFRSSSLFGNGETLHRAERSKIKPFLDPEWQAWEFARACLMPRQLIVQYYEEGYSRYDMAVEFNVNPAFVDVRLSTLKLKPF
jgi:hypothetical protein